MDRLQQYFVMRAVVDGEWQPDRGGNRRVATANELDAFADFGWQWPDLKGVLATSAHGLRVRWRSAALQRAAGSPLRSGDASRGA